LINSLGIWRSAQPFSAMSALSGIAAIPACAGFHNHVYSETVEQKTRLRFHPIE
jgi:hypothetical protein